MKETSSDGLWLHAHGGEFEAYGRDVGHVWFARIASMPFVCLFSKNIRTLNQLLVSLSQVSYLTNNFIRSNNHKFHCRDLLLM